MTESEGDTFSTAFNAQNYLGSPGSFCSILIFMMFLKDLCEEECWLLIKIALNLCTVYDKVAISQY